MYVFYEKFVRKVIIHYLPLPVVRVFCVGIGWIIVYQTECYHLMIKSEARDDKDEIPADY